MNFAKNYQTLEGSKLHFKESYASENFKHDKYMYLNSLARRVLSLSPPFSVCTPFSVSSPFGYLGCFKSNFDAVKAKVELFNE